MNPSLSIRASAAIIYSSLIFAFNYCNPIVAIGKEKAAPLSDVEKVLVEPRQMLSSGRPEDCETRVAEILRNDSTNVDARQLHAEALYQLRRYHYAADEDREVLKVRPDDPAACLLMGKILQSIHQPAKAVEYYNKYLGLVKASDTTAQYKTLVQVLSDEAKSQAEQHAKSRAEVGDYLAAVGGNGFAKWSEPQSIRVHVNSGQGVEGYRPEFEEALRQAFDDWTQSTDGKIAFVFVADPANAQMVVTWTSDLKAPALKAEAGLAKTSWGSDGLNKADILLLTLDPFKEGPIGTNYLFNVCLHEIGHALGLQGHSPHSEDIMSPQLYTQQGLSDRDINTVLALYSNKMSSDSMPATDEYGRPLSASVKCDRLVQAGSAAAMAGQYDKAIEKLKAALGINPNIELARKNLAVAANNLAIASGTAPEKEISLLHLALYWEPTNMAARQNLSALMQSQGKDPKSPGARISIAEQCLNSNDTVGAIVEYNEALALKEDPAIRSKLSLLKARSASK